MSRKSRTAAVGALLAVTLVAPVAHADWNVGYAYKMHFPQLPDTIGYDVNFTAPWSVADDWRCSDTGPVSDIHFWFSSRGDSLNLQLPLTVQMTNIRVSIYSDVPQSPNDPFSHPGTLLWQRDFAPDQVKIRQTGKGSQYWYDPANGAVVQNDHHKIYQCNITKITDPFYQKRGHIYWLVVSISTPAPEYQLGWKSSDQSQYPPGYTGLSFLDDAVWSPPAGGWHDIHYPTGPQQGKSMDMAFVITGFRKVFNHKMHFPQYPDPTGADVNFTYPQVAADDWTCSETGPVEDVHFWFSAQDDWINPQLPLIQQIYGIHLSIHADIPAGPGNPYSKPGPSLWELNLASDDPHVQFSKCYTEGQDWMDPAQNGYLIKDHRIFYRCDIDSLPGAVFTQQKGTIYWLDVSLTAQLPVGWKTADVDLYPAPYTGMHYLDDAVWAQNLTVPPIPWLDLIWPAVAPRAGESIDLSFVITRKPDPTGAGEAPKQYNLEQNYPNPFNPSTTIRYSLPEAANVELAIFGVDGALVRVLDTGMKPAGVFEAHWDGKDRRGHAVASGVYFYRLRAGTFTETRKMVLMK